MRRARNGANAFKLERAALFAGDFGGLESGGLKSLAAGPLQESLDRDCCVQSLAKPEEILSRPSHIVRRSTGIERCQAFGFPVVGKLTSELPCHEPAHERTSEPFMFRRPVEGWATMLFPGQQKFVLLHGPVDVDVASRRRKCPILGCVRGEFVHNKSNARDGVPADRKTRPGDDVEPVVFAALRIDVGSEDRLDESVQGRVLARFPVPVDQAGSREPVCARERAQPITDRLGHVRRRAGGTRTQGHQATRNGEKVLDAMAHLSEEKILLFLSSPALGDVAGDF